MSKTKNKIRVNFVGSNAASVSGSCIYIEGSKYRILLDCGLYQSNSLKEDYKVNSTKFPFKPKNIDFVFISHTHIDHIGKIPALYAQGCTARIICPRGTKALFQIMCEDSAYILERDAETLNRMYKMKASPIYTKEDVYNAMQYIEEYDFNELVKLTDEIKFNFIPSGHILAAAQIELWLKEKNQIKKIVYTGDLGNKVSKYYVEKFIPIQNANLVIGEATYSNDLRVVTNKDREIDLKKIETVVRETCLEKKNKVLIPTFSLDRTQNILTYIYKLFKDDKNFNIPVILDSPLATHITECYMKLLPEDERNLLEEVLQWKNLIITEDFEESLALQESKNPMLVIAASGFMQAGRSRAWAKKLVPKRDAHIIFIGFSTENSLAGKLKNIHKYKSISIDNKQYANRCNVTSLHSFSSHMQHDDMLEYYSDINCERIALVHSEYKGKCKFGKALQEKIYKKNRTSKVIITNRSTCLLI